MLFHDISAFGIPAITLAAGTVAGFLAGRFMNFSSKTITSGVVDIAASTISGRGAFALRDIREGETVERCPALEVADKDVAGELLNYVFYGSDETKRLVAMGNGMLFNHASDPNVAYYRQDGALGAELIIYALKNIRKGEEMFYNYGDDWWETRQS
ncbi:MAG: SET domain-containing protein [Chlorobiaceae bacterium]|nr:SET domain-containing protein [Chlorobiaceae bacterium]